MTSPRKTSPPDPPAADLPLAEIVLNRPGAARVFHRFGIDFCCHGQASLRAACAAKGLDPRAVLDEIDTAPRDARAEPRDWRARPAPELIDHLVAHYHARHREEFPRFIDLARTVERVHAAKPACPRGLAEGLERFAAELERHMRKEEEELFPLVRAGRGRVTPFSVRVLEQEHEDVALALAGLRERAHDFVAPPEACPTWRALYAGLAELELELMRHVHLENNVLFPRVLRG